MARLIDADALEANIKKMFKPYGDGTYPGDYTAMIHDETLVDVLETIEEAPTVDAVEVEKYIELLEQYDKVFMAFHELRDDFISYVCDGVPNPSPYCKNKCHGCVDAYGWCKHNEKCQGFNPAEVFLIEEKQKMDGGKADG